MVPGVRGNRYFELIELVAVVHHHGGQHSYRHAHELAPIAHELNCAGRKGFKDVTLIGLGIAIQRRDDLVGKRAREVQRGMHPSNVEGHAACVTCHHVLSEAVAPRFIILAGDLYGL